MRNSSSVVGIGVSMMASSVATNDEGISTKQFIYQQIDIDANYHCTVPPKRFFCYIVKWLPFVCRYWYIVFQHNFHVFSVLWDTQKALSVVWVLVSFLPLTSFKLAVHISCFFWYFMCCYRAILVFSLSRQPCRAASITIVNEVIKMWRMWRLIYLRNKQKITKIYSNIQPIAFYMLLVFKCKRVWTA